MTIKEFIGWAIVAVLVGIMMMLAQGCASVSLERGDVRYSSYGDHVLKDLEVTRTMPNGEKITVKVKSSDSKEVEAVSAAIGLALEALKRVPIAPLEVQR